METKQKLLIALLAFLTAACGTLTTVFKFALDKQRVRQDNYEIWNNNKHDEQDCRNLNMDSLIKNNCY